MNGEILPFGMFYILSLAVSFMSFQKLESVSTRLNPWLMMCVSAELPRCITTPSSADIIHGAVNGPR